MAAKPSLSRYDKSADASPQARAARRYREPGPKLDVLGSGDCWCGREFNHSWPGKADSQPHPRVADLIPIQRDGDAALILECGHSQELAISAVPYFGGLLIDGMRTLCMYCPSANDMRMIIAVMIQRRRKNGDVA
jgi:hypothetical protein